MGAPCLAIIAAALLMAACARPGLTPDSAATATPGQPPVRAQSSANATFETPASSREDARAAGLPILLRGNTLIYPDIADPQTTGNGWVNLLITVSPDGSVAAAKVLDSSNPVFNDAAIAAAHSWIFAPHTREQSFTHRMFVTAPGVDDHYQPTGIDH